MNKFCEAVAEPAMSVAKQCSIGESEDLHGEQNYMVPLAGLEPA